MVRLGNPRGPRWKAEAVTIAANGASPNPRFQLPRTKSMNHNSHLDIAWYTPPTAQRTSRPLSAVRARPWTQTCTHSSSSMIRFLMICIATTPLHVHANARARPCHCSDRNPANLSSTRRAGEEPVRSIMGEASGWALKMLYVQISMLEG